MFQINVNFNDSHLKQTFYTVLNLISSRTAFVQNDYYIINISGVVVVNNNIFLSERQNKSILVTK